ncbi:MAG TPA: transaldolase, partial [Paracoccus sp. (in: a-proteobacteria)]|nr:transaldolase [Paracoccus sp. (in: a-proteobacteria)]
MNRIGELQEHGQAVWLDFLARDFIAQGRLAALVGDGLRGVTSNPSIFQKAIGSGDEYDAAFAALLKEGDRPVTALYEAVAVEDIQNAADVLRPVYDSLDGRDGFVSIEVSPYLAHDTEATIAEARRLWSAVGRPNLMVKVPGTAEGLPAIEELTAQGINVNITLLFSQGIHRQVLDAYMAGLERFAASGGDLSGIASVASIFVSRIDTEADKRIDERIAQGGDKARLAALKGKVAIANAKLAYADYQRLFAGARWQR